MPKPSVSHYRDALLMMIVRAIPFAIQPRSVYVLTPTSEMIADVIQLLHFLNSLYCVLTDMFLSLKQEFYLKNEKNMFNRTIAVKTCD